jgi:hypothetical protein
MPFVMRAQRGFINNRLKTARTNGPTGGAPISLIGFRSGSPSFRSLQHRRGIHNEQEAIDEPVRYTQCADGGYSERTSVLSVEMHPRFEDAT